MSRSSSVRRTNSSCFDEGALPLSWGTMAGILP
jgi:hypothetical protein